MNDGYAKLLKWLKREGMRKAELARVLGVTAPAIFRWGTGSRPSIDLAVALERITGGEVPASSWASPGAVQRAERRMKLCPTKGPGEAE